MKRLSAVLMTIMAIIFFSRLVSAETTVPQPIKEPSVQALGAVLMDYRTGRVLWGKNEHKPMAMASTTKIMTAVLALESGKLDDICVASQNAADAPKVKMGLSAGEEIKMSDLLFALMLESQNDAAVAIAEHIGGSVENFCAMMTIKARKLGTINTVFETPNGLDKGNHHSTAYDMALITRYALANPAFVRLINTKNISFSSNKRSYSFVNKNRFLYEYEGANGVKTGFTNKAGHCFVGAAQRGGMELISVVLLSGKSERWLDTKTIFNYGFTNFKYYDIVKAGQQAGTVSVERSRRKTVGCVFGEGVILPLRADEINEIDLVEYLPKLIKAPVNSGDILGNADIFINDSLWARIPLKASAAAERHDLKTSIEKILNCTAQLSTRANVKVILPEF